MKIFWTNETEESSCYSNACKSTTIGGLYANGVIGDEFVAGQDIEISLDVTANHMGWHEFRMCVWNDIYTLVSRSSFVKPFNTVFRVFDTIAAPILQNVLSTSNSI